ncbi:hypothetical protein CAC42_7937 [Sphaceloma murrayae]|uniref:14-3-3 domain-containing protein n=1 Tax=Sphaceloma murrayae TaxID=2082308 RepID=A0A2K1QY98_9PEZI|nr:hypothetical protein CAC42_7937 [Sphaceloma murrayae]
MAASDIDQKILGQIAKDVGRSNPLLSSALYQILGLSVLLSRKLYRARKLRRLDVTRDTKSMTLYHQIIWLSREGLAITEIMILPYCQNGSQSARCRVMAAKLRASFYHVFCLFHNHPTISQLTPPKTSPSAKDAPQKDEPAADKRVRQAVLRETIPSMTSETSYVTNPYALSGPAQTSPPPYPPPPIPAIQANAPTTPPSRQQGFLPHSSAQRSPPSSADFLMPPLNFVPAATVYFSQANVLAKRLLPGSDPLRLSVAFESCAFTWECGKDFALAKEKAKTTIREVYSAPEGMEDADFDDAATLVQAIAAIAKRNDSTQPSSRSLTPSKREPLSVSPSSSPTQRPASKPASLRSSPRARRPRSRTSQKAMSASSRKQEKMPATTVTETKSSGSDTQASKQPTRRKPKSQLHIELGTGSEAPESGMKAIVSDRPPAPPPKEPLPAPPTAPSQASKKSPRRPRSKSQASQSSTGTNMSEKERKRRIVEQAEERLRRRNVASGQSSASER